MNRFEREVLSELDGWAVSKGFFFKMPVDHILCGFLPEKLSFAHVIWRFALPICDRQDDIYFTFGNRLREPGEYVLREGGKQLSPEDFLRITAPYREDVARLGDLEAFAGRFANSLHSSGAHRGYGCVLILLGRYDEAASELQKCFSDVRDEAHTRDTHTLLETLLKDPAAAVSLLQAWEAETKRTLNIP